MKIKKAHLQYGDLIHASNTANPITLVSDIWVPGAGYFAQRSYYQGSLSPRKIRVDDRCECCHTIRLTPPPNVFVKKFYHFEWRKNQIPQVIGVKKPCDPGYQKIIQWLKTAAMCRENLIGQGICYKLGYIPCISEHGIAGNLYLLKVAPGQNGWTSSSLLKRIQARVIRTEIK